MLPTSRQQVVVMEFGNDTTQWTFARANLLWICYGETGLMKFGLYIYYENRTQGTWKTFKKEIVRQVKILGLPSTSLTGKLRRNWCNRFWPLGFLFVTARMSISYSEWLNSTCRNIPYLSSILTLLFAIFKLHHYYYYYVLVVQWLSVGLGIERSLVRLPAGALSSQLGQLSLPSLRDR